MVAGKVWGKLVLNLRCPVLPLWGFLTQTPSTPKLGEREAVYPLSCPITGSGAPYAGVATLPGTEDVIDISTCHHPLTVTHLTSQWRPKRYWEPIGMLKTEKVRMAKKSYSGYLQ